MKQVLLCIPLTVLLAACQQTPQASLPSVPDNLIDAGEQLQALNIWTGTRTGGTTGARFGAYYDPSVANFAYTGAMDNARASWNNISTRVAISKVTTSTNADVYFVSASDQGTTVGQTFAYATATASPTTDSAGYNANWHHMAIVMYDGTVINQFPNDSTARLNTVRRCAIHEVGHTLKMAHDAQAAGQSIMDPICNQATGVMPYNRSELIRKWGQ